MRHPVTRPALAVIVTVALVLLLGLLPFKANEIKRALQGGHGTLGDGAGRPRRGDRHAYPRLPGR